MGSVGDDTAPQWCRNRYEAAVSPAGLLQLYIEIGWDI
jgi:hypothetical protein